MRGAEKEGAAGLIKGIGKGIGGLILKPGAGEFPPLASKVITNMNQSSYLGNSRIHVHGNS